MKFYRLLFLFLLPSSLWAQTKVLFTGNTADASPAFFQALKTQLAEEPSSTFLLINGDLITNCDPLNALPPRPGTQMINGQIVDPRDEALAPAAALIDVLRGAPHIEAYLVPGDRDWDDSGEDGWDCVRELEDYLEDQKLPNLHWPHDRGCPGPKVKELSSYLTLISINTQWWNHPHRKPSPADAECRYSEPEVVMEELQDAIEENRDKNVLFLGHFPPYSQGRYGGHFPLSDHLLPPLAGSIRVAYRQSVGTPKDLNNEYFSELANELLSFAEQYQGLICLGSHEANQQIIFSNNNYIINSGATAKARYVHQGGPALFTAAQAGIMELQYDLDGAVAYRFLALQDNRFSVAKEGQLFQPPCLPQDGSAVPVNPSYAPCLKEVNPNDLLEPVLTLEDTVVAGPDYAAGGLYRTFFGAHYRDSWTEPIRVPILDLKTELGGLQPIKRGGGRQTQSLKLQTSQGNSYVFRSVDKDPRAALAVPLRNTIIADVTQDQTSSQHPYGAIAVSHLLDQLDILHARPRLFLMPDGPRLGPFRTTFGNMLGMLEVRPTGPDDGQPGTFRSNEIYKSHELFAELYENQDWQLVHEEFARARLFDILIGDWSKHEDNWKWAGFKNAKGQWEIRPIPRDRDHAFSNLDGLIPWLASRRWAIPNLEHFDYRIQDVRSLTYQARHMDRLLSSEIPREVWLEQARYIQEQLDQATIQTAVQQMPPEIYPISGQEIAAKLEQRLSDLPEYAEEFYTLLAEQVDVVGTNREERFVAERSADGSTLVQVIDLKGDEAGRVLYERRFLPRETQEIRLYGLGNDDQFSISGEAERAIPIRIIGGPGQDVIENQSRIRRGGKNLFVYEKSEKAPITLGRKAKRVQSWQDELYYYDRRAFAYNTYLPIAYLAFTSFNGVQFGGGVRFTRRNFTHRDYSSKHRLAASASTIGNYGFSYEGEWHHVLRKWDVMTQLQIDHPSTRNFFFGLGSNSVNEEELFDDDYYFIFLNQQQAAVGIRREFRRWSEFSLLAGYESNQTTREENTILGESQTFFGQGELSFWTLTPTLELDLRDHKVFPTRGIRFQAQQEWGFLDGNTFGVSRFSGEYFVTPRWFPLTLGMKAGYASSQGQVPFYKLPSIGMQNGLRGYQRQRFTGDELVYINTEFQVPVLRWQTSIIPLTLGLRGFFDWGRIDGADNEWKMAYGGGIYVVPLSRSYTLSLLLGFSEEESGLVNLQVGTNF